MNKEDIVRNLRDIANRIESGSDEIVDVKADISSNDSYMFFGVGTKSKKKLDFSDKEQERYIHPELRDK